MRTYEVRANKLGKKWKEIRAESASSAAEEFVKDWESSIDDNFEVRPSESAGGVTVEVRWSMHDGQIMRAFVVRSELIRKYSSSTWRRNSEFD